MADETTTTTTDTTTTDNATSTTGTAKTFTEAEHQAELTRIATREKKQGEAAILSALGLTSKEEIAAAKEILASNKAGTVTAADVQKSFDEYKAKTEAEKFQMKQDAWIDKNKIPPRETAFYLSEISKRMTVDNVDFATAADLCLKDNPVAPAHKMPPPMYGGSGKNPTGTPLTEKQQAKRKYHGLK